MGERIFFSYLVGGFLNTYYLSVDDIIKATRFDKTLINLIDETVKIIPIFKDINHVKKFNISLDEEIKYKHFKTLVSWEHRTIIQPRLLKTFNSMGHFVRFFIKHVPGRLNEIIFLKRFNLRSTFSLSCFTVRKYLRTKNFMSPSDRIKQAKDFYLILRELEYDPNMQCFNDRYYISKFPNSFYRSPERYLENYFYSY